MRRLPFAPLFLLITAFTVQPAAADIIDSDSPANSSGFYRGLRFTPVVAAPPSETFTSDLLSIPNAPFGTLDTAANQVNYSGFNLTIGSATHSTTRMYSRVIPAQPPVCDANGCTEGSPEMTIQEPFTFMTTFNSSTWSLPPVSVPVTSYGVSTAMTDLAQGFQFSPVTGTWSITGPTEFASGNFSVTAGSHFNTLAISRSISIERTPSGTGPVTGWRPTVSGMAFTDLQTVAQGVTVDGRQFNIMSVPEPSGLMLVAIGLAGMAFRRNRSGRA